MPGDPDLGHNALGAIFLIQRDRLARPLDRRIATGSVIAHIVAPVVVSAGDNDPGLVVVLAAKIRCETNHPELTYRAGMSDLIPRGPRIISYVMPFFGLELLGMAREVAAFNRPARVGISSGEHIRSARRLCLSALACRDGPFWFNEPRQSRQREKP